MDWATTTTILGRLARPEDQHAWDRFFQCHHGTLVRFGRRLGLSTADADDTAQETLLRFAKAYREGRYDRTKGRLRDWLFGFARRVALNTRDRGAPSIAVVQVELDELPDPQLERVWQDVWEQSVLRTCLDRVAREVTPETFRIFELAGLRDTPPAEVAESLRISTNTVYLAKHRVTKRLRAMAAEYERPD